MADSVQSKHTLHQIDTAVSEVNENRVVKRSEGHGEPALSTVGAIGQHYLDVDTGKEYRCVKIENGIYIWVDTAPEIVIELETITNMDIEELINNYVEE